MEALDLNLFTAWCAALVLAVTAPAVYFITRWYGKHQVRGKSIQVHEVLPLGTNRALYVVEWEAPLPLGVGPQAINLIDTAAAESTNERNQSDFFCRQPFQFHVSISE